MPLGFERLNVRQRSPNERIVFIKPLEGPDKATSQDFLERIAAICAPIMKANCLSVASLEEYEPNREFWGRNFNAGEVIQLVLKSPSNGRWLPFHFVQLVMMHELAHCKQMNHSGAFWKVRNEYTGDLKALLAKNYTGDGFWGKGQTLYDGQYTQDTMPAADQMPQHLCGGVYRSGRGKRRRKPGQDKPVLSYAERKQRRIEKKFGTNGLALGQDDEKRVRLENGKVVKGKPRVAGSVRGRELRAAAALARFGQASEIAVKQESTESETEDEYEEEDPGIKQEAIDANGKKILDSKGNGLIKVCEDEDVRDDHNAQREMEELGQIGQERSSTKAVGKNGYSMPGSPVVKLEEEDISTASESEGEDVKEGQTSHLPQKTAKPETTTPLNQAIANQSSPEIEAPNGPDAQPRRPRPLAVEQPLQSASEKFHGAKGDPLSRGDPSIPSNPSACPICSLENAPDALTCAACAHVLRPEAMLNHWACESSTCTGGQYINSGDSGLCGLCGAARATPEKR